MIEILLKLVDSLNQQTSEGCESIILRLQESIDSSSRIIINPATRSIFLSMSTRICAENLCTTLARYIDIYAESLINGLPVLVPPFSDFYLRAINDGIIVSGKKIPELCYINDDKKLMKSYGFNQYWEISRKQYGNDNQMINVLQERSKDIILIRDGLSPSQDSHTLCAIKNENDYRILDTFHGDRYGKNMRERYSPDSDRFLHYIYGYDRGE